MFLFVLGHMVITWGLVNYFEPSAEYVKPEVYWYFYFVTISTVGYGDFSPAELGSRIVVVGLIMPIGIAVFGALIGKIAVVFAEVSEKARRGLMSLHLENHVIVVGDNTQRTIDLLENLLADKTVGKVVLISTREENPLNGRLAGFVSGEVTNKLVRDRARLESAKTIAVLADSDPTVTGRTIAVMNANKTARIVAYFQHGSAAQDLDDQTGERVETVVSVDMHAVVQEMLDPGAAGFTRQLLHNGFGETYLRLEVPEGVESPVVDVSVALMCSQVNLLGVYQGDTPVICPDPHMTLEAGDVLAVAALNREALSRVDWSRLQ